MLTPIASPLSATNPAVWVWQFKHPTATRLTYRLEVPAELVQHCLPKEAADIIARLFMLHAPAMWRTLGWYAAWCAVLPHLLP